MKKRLLLAVLLFAGALTAAEIRMEDFSSWKKSGSLRLESPKPGITLIHGEMQGGELRTTVPASHLKNFHFAVIERRGEQGPWSFLLADGLDRIELKPLDPDAVLLHYALRPEMAEGRKEITFAIRLSPDAVLEISAFLLSDREKQSGRYVPHAEKGPERVFDSPIGQFRIPRRFEDVTPEVRREDVKFEILPNDPGLRSYIVDDIMELNPQLRPSPAEFQRSLRLFAAPDQYEGAFFSVYALTEAGGVTVSASVPVKSGNRKLPQPELRRIRIWPQRTNFVSLQYRDVPELLEKNRPCDLAAGTAQSYYLKFHIPPDAEPGVYTGKITCRARGKAPLELEYAIRVVDFKFDSSFRPLVGIYYGAPELFGMIRSYGFTSVLQGHQNCMRDVLKILDEIAAGEPDVAARLKRLYAGKELPQLRFDSPSPFGLDNFLKAYRAAGLKRLICWLAVGGFTDRMANFLKLPLHRNINLRFYPAELTPEYRKLFRDCIRAINERARQSGIEIDWYQFDELGINSNSESFAYAREMFRLVKEAGGHTADTVAEDEFTEMISPWLDTRIYSVSAGDEREKLMRIRKSTEKAKAAFFSYTDITQERPWRIRYEAGYNMWLCGWSGKFFWNLHSRRQNPFDDFDHPQKDSMALYTMPDGETIPTLQLEAAREGIDDLRSLHTVEHLAAQACRSKLPEVRAAGEAVKKELGVLRESMPLQYENKKWDFRNFKRNRWRLMQLGGELQNLLNGGKKSPELRFYPADSEKKKT